MVGKYVLTIVSLKGHIARRQVSTWVAIEVHHDGPDIDQGPEVQDTDDVAEVEAQGEALLVIAVPDVHQAPTAATEATTGTIVTDDRFYLTTTKLKTQTVTFLTPTNKHIKLCPKTHLLNFILTPIPEISSSSKTDFCLLKE